VLGAYVVGSLLFGLLAAAVLVGLANGRPWLGGVVMMIVGLIVLSIVILRR
jgi:hypothetical protein